MCVFGEGQAFNSGSWGFDIFTDRNNVGLAFFTPMATGAIRYVPSGLLHLEGPFWNRRRDITEFVIFATTCFELLLTYFILSIVEVSKCTDLQRELCNWLITIFGRGSNVPTAILKSLWRQDFRWYECIVKIYSANCQCFESLQLPCYCGILFYKMFYCVHRVMDIFLSFDNLTWLSRYLRAACVPFSICKILSLFPSHHGISVFIDRFCSNLRAQCDVLQFGNFPTTSSCYESLISWRAFAFCAVEPLGTSWSTRQELHN